MKSEKNFSIHSRVFCHEDTKAQSFTKMNAQLFFKFHTESDAGCFSDFIFFFL